MAQRPFVIRTDVDKVNKNIRALAALRIYVGIPSANAGRQDSSITNAVIGYVMENGMPEKNVPARPFLKPGVKAVEQQTINGMRRAAREALVGSAINVQTQMMAIGQRAVNSVKNTIRAGIPPPIAASTVRNRLRRTQAGRQRLRRLQNEQALFAFGASGMTPLIDTSQLINSITYVIRKENGQR